jgi:hypothetical protein
MMRMVSQFARRLRGRHGSAIRIVSFLTLASGVFIAGHESDATACGACYANQSESTIVNDHRMALSVSPNVTVLWDQIAYSGNPTEFAYVIPARRGTRLEVSNDAWFAALDASTRPIIMAPQSGYYPGGSPGGTSSSGGTRRPSTGETTGRFGTGRGSDAWGCCSTTTTEAAGGMVAESGPQWGSKDAGAAVNGEAPPEEVQADPVQILSQEVVGPYETVILRSEDPEALFEWLVGNDFSIPETSKPIVEDYVKAGLDFIAMRMRPSPTQQARAMEPIRIVAPGADPTLPLRMMRIGSGANLGITLFVIGESPYRAKTFPNVTVDESKIVWDYSQNRSNYIQLSFETMTAGDSRGWLTEYSQQPVLYPTGTLGQTGMIGNPGLADAYDATCPANLKFVAPDASVTFDSGKPPSDGGADGQSDAETDAGAIDAGSSDAGAADAGPPPPPPLPPRPRTKQCDDLELALEGLTPQDVWVTRMRAFLPNAAMDATLELEPYSSNGFVDNVHYAATYGTVALRIAPSRSTRGTWAVIILSMLALRGIVRRSRRLGG